MHEIEVKFSHRQDTITYTMEILNMLLDDPNVEYIVDNQTGAVIFDRKSGYMDIPA